MEQVEFHPSKEQFEIEYIAEEPMGDKFKEAVTSVIIFPGVRKFFGDVGGQLNK